MDKERTTREGQVTYLAISDETAGLPTGSGTPFGARCVFIFVVLCDYAFQLNHS
jgi:hypothetical protein